MLAALANDAESWTSSAANLAQVAAIAVGGLWAYNRFIRERDEWPKATLEQRIQHRRLDGEHTLVRVWLKVENVGAVKMATDPVRTDVYQVLPVDREVTRAIDEGTLIPEGGLEAQWPCIASRERTGAGEIEPAEADEFGFDFIVPTEIETAFVYSYIGNPKKDQLGWSLTSLYDLGEHRGEQRQRAERVGRHKE
jgi:hypothetical protein